MELSSLWYMSFWSIVSQISLLIALVASNKANLPVPESIWVASFLLYIYVTACFSSFYAFFVRPMMEPDLANGNVSKELHNFFTYFLLDLVSLVYCSLHLLWPQKSSVFFIVFMQAVTYVLLGFMCLNSFYVRYMKSKEMGNLLIGFAGPFLLYPSHTLFCALFIASLFSFLYLTTCQGLCEAKEVIESFISFFVIAFAGVQFRFIRDVSHEMSYLVENKKEDIKKLETPLLLLGYVLSQYCIQEKSVSLLVMLSSLAIFWLANLAMIQPETDCGILNFFVGAILDSAVSLFGLGIFTWIILAGCVILVLLSRKLNSVEVRYPRPRSSTLSYWRSLEGEIAKGRFYLFRDRAEGRQKESRGKGKLSHDIFRFLSCLYLCAIKSSMEEKAGKKEESKSELADKLRCLTLQLLEQKEEGMEKQINIRNELILTLCHLYCRLRNVEEKRMGEQSNDDYRIALCLYLVLWQLQKKEKTKEEEREDGQEKRVETMEGPIIILCHIILGQLLMEKKKRKEEEKGKQKECKERVDY